MKNLLVILSLACVGSLFAQGKYAGEQLKPLIGKVYKNQKELPALDGYTYRGGTMITNFDDPEKLAGQWFLKGTNAVVVFERINDDDTREIIDVLEVKNVKKNQEIKIGDCQNGEAEMVGIVALVTTKDQERLPAIKAWNLNRDKLRIEIFASERVSCLGMVGEN